MKKTLLTLLGILSVATCNASTVSLSKGLNPGFNIQSSAGVVLTNFTILVGAFDMNPIAPTALTLKALLATTAFSEFGRATAPAGGLVTASITRNDFSTGPAASAFNGKNIYAVIMDSTTSAASNQFGLITVDTTSPAGTWVFPADTTSALVTTNAPTGLLTNFATQVGSEIDNATGPETLRLQVVPEASTSFLVLLSVGLLARRKR